MQKQLLSDFLFVDGRSFQHSIIVILKVFQGSAQSYKTQQKSRFYWYKKKAPRIKLPPNFRMDCMWDYELLFNWPYTHEVALLTRIGSLHFCLKYTKLLGMKRWQLVEPAILSETVPSNSVNLHQGRSQGGVLGCPWRPLLQGFFNQTTYNRWRKCHDDIMAIV